MNLTKTLKDIKSLKIQGATSVALKGCEAFYFHSKQNKHLPLKKYILKLNEAKNKLINIRVTEPMLKNSLNFMTKDLTGSVDEIHSHIFQSYKYLKSFFNDNTKKINEIVSKKLKKGMVVFTHCHSSTVINSLIYSKKKGIKFIVNNTETRPLYQGRITAKDLSKNGILVNHYVDSSMIEAIKFSDLVLLGSDSILSTGDVINKIGSNLICKIAYEYSVPVFIITPSWKLDSNSSTGSITQIEGRDPKEVWDVKSKNIKIHNPAFELIPSKYISGIISELGLYSVDVFLDDYFRKY